MHGLRASWGSQRTYLTERRRAGEYLERVYTYIAGPVPVVSARGRGYVYVVMDDFTRAICGFQQCTFAIGCQ